MSNPYEDVDECKCYVLFFSLIEFSNGPATMNEYIELLPRTTYSIMSN